MAPFVITGAQGGKTQGAEAPNRLEISDFVKNEQFFSLYVQALGMSYCVFMLCVRADHYVCHD